MTQTMKTFTTKSTLMLCAIMIALLCGTSNVQAQMFGANAYFKTAYMEIGINGQGGQEGCPTPMPPGMHHRSHNAIMGFVTNPQKNAWATYDGDFFTPGSPESGWALKIGCAGADYNNNDNMLGFGDIPGAITSFSRTGTCLTAMWDGNLTKGGNNIHVKIIYDAEDGRLHYNTTVLLTNNSSTVIPDMYYMRTLDPDNNVMMSGGSFMTVNENEEQASSNSCSLTCISAITGPGSPFSTPGPPTYMALAAVGGEYRASIGGFSNRNACQVWQGTGYTQTVATPIYCDCAIALAARVQTLAPGATATLKFVTILNKADKGLAVQGLMKLTFPGSVLNPATACSPPDTVPACNGIVPLSITGPLLASYTFSWAPSAGLSTTTGPSVLCSVSSITNYTCFGTPLSACAAPLEFRFVVEPSIGPALTSTVTTNSPICAGRTASLSVVAPSPLTYYWTGPNSFTSAVQSPTIGGFSPLTAGVYTSVVTTTAYCSISNTVDVRLGVDPTIIIGSNSPVCETKDLYLNSSGAVTYTWTGPSGFASNLQNPSISPAVPLNSGTYTLVGQGVDCPITKTIAVTVIPVVPVTIAPLPITCNNATISLLASNGGTTYAWTGPNSFTSSLQNPSITPAKAKHRGIYRVVSTTINGCVNSATIAVDVYDTLRLKDISPNITLCSGKTATLATSGGVGGSGLYDFIWSPSIYLDAPNLSVTGTTANATTIYSLTLSDTYCPMTVPRTLTVEVTVNPIPVITYSTSNARGCEPFITHFETFSVPTASTAIWSFSKDLASENARETAYTFPTKGSYDMKLVITDVNGCVDSVAENGFIVVDPKPYPDFDYTPFDPNILVNEVNFTDHSSIGLPMQKWHWMFGDGFAPANRDSSNKQNASHVYENIGSFPVSLEVTNSFGCKETTTKIVKIIDDFSMFIPNAFTPTKKEGKNDIFTAQGNGFFAESFEMTIFDRWGEVIYKTNDINKGWDGSVKGGSTAKPGVYVYKIKVRDYKNRPKEFTGHVTLL